MPKKAAWRFIAGIKKAPAGAFSNEAELTAAQNAKAFVEAVNTTTSINHLLLTSVERVAS